MTTTQAPPGAEVLDGLLTTSDVCRVFGRSYQTVRKWRVRRSMPYVVVPGTGRDTIRYRREDVDEWARKNKDEPWANRNGLVLRPKWGELRKHAS